MCMKMPQIDYKTWMTFRNIILDQKLSCKADISSNAGPGKHIISIPLQVFLNRSVQGYIHNSLSFSLQYLPTAAETLIVYEHLMQFL